MLQMRRFGLTVLLLTVVAAVMLISTPWAERAPQGRVLHAAEGEESLTADAETTAPPALPLVEGDVLGLVGGTTLVEADAIGLTETLLRVRGLPPGVRIRSLAREADTVFYQGRDLNFGDWAAQLQRGEATVLLVQFGQMEFLAADADLETFIVAYDALLEELSASVPRIIILSPTPMESAGAPLPPLAERNEELTEWVEAIGDLADRRGLPFIDAFYPLLGEAGGVPALTTNGVRLTNYGQGRLAEIVAGDLGYPAALSDDWDIVFDPEQNALAPAEIASLRETILAKNALWKEYWRPTNWAFLLGDRQHVASSRDHEDWEHRWFPEEWQALLPLVARAEYVVARQSAELTDQPFDQPEPPAPAELAEEPDDRPRTSHTVEEELASFHVAEGFEVNLFADESDGIANPIQMRWDAEGRLWVICSWQYPQGRPAEAAGDKLLVLEDTDGDGRADRTTVFTDGLAMPMGLELGDGGVYVGEGDKLLHFVDTDGDLVADERRVVFSGFGTGDTHQNINSFIWSPDGRLMMSQGLHCLSHVETPWGVARLEKAGVWEFDPRAERMLPLLNGSMGPANPWGTAFDDWGQATIVAGNGEGIYYLTPASVPTDHFERYPQIWDQHRKFCGSDIVGTPHLPAEMQGDLILGGFFNNGLYRFKLEDDGAGFRAVEAEPLIVSSDLWFRAVDVKIGPEGAIYVADWCNPIIGHYQASFRHPDRDKDHGRIWRITATDRPLDEPPELSELETAELVEYLHPRSSRWVRYQTRRLLAERDADEVAGALLAWLQQLPAEQEETYTCVREAISIAEWVGRPQLGWLMVLTDSPDYRDRAYAARMAGCWYAAEDRSLFLLEDLAFDEHPRVRLEAVVACSRVPTPYALRVALCVLEEPTDRFLQYALTQTVHELSPYWKPALADGSLDYWGQPKQLLFLLEADRSPDSLPYVRQMLAGNSLPRDTHERLLCLLATIGEADDLASLLTPASAELFDENNQRQYDPAAHARVLTAMAAAYDTRKVQPGEAAEEPLAALLASDDASLQQAALVLAGKWQWTALAEPIATLAASEETSSEIRQAAYLALAQLGQAEAQELLVQVAQTADSREDRRAAIAALARADLTRACDLACTWINESGPYDEHALLIAELLRQAYGVEHLIAALQRTPLTPDAARLALRGATTAGCRYEPLLAVMREQAEIEADPPEYDERLVEQLLREVAEHGDAMRGQAVLRDAQSICLTCHALAGAGGARAPDLEQVGVGIPPQQIVEAILWPNRQVKEEYMSLAVYTVDGRVERGYRVYEDVRELVLWAEEDGRELHILKEDIDEVVEAGSIMPTGTTDLLTEAQLYDLIAFLTETGRPGPLRAPLTNYVRTWRVAGVSPSWKIGDWSALTEHEHVTPANPAVNWIDLVSQIDGSLPVADVLPPPAATGGARFGLVEFTLEANRPAGQVLSCNNPSGLTIWLDGERIASGDFWDQPLPPGQHVVTLGVQADRREDAPLLLEWRGG